MEAVMAYAQTLIGVPYRWHRAGDEINGTDKFWAANSPHVTREEIDAVDKCIVCTGLINLMRRFQGLPVPGVHFPGKQQSQDWETYPGTTGTWFEILEDANKLEKYDSEKQYPKGTLLLRNFASIEEDQGHVAIVWDEEEKTMLHATPDYSYAESKSMSNVGCVKVESLIGWETYFTHVCLPENWLEKN